MAEFCRANVANFQVLYKHDMVVPQLWHTFCQQQSSTGYQAPDASLLMRPLEPGDGTWTCIVCGSDGPGLALECIGKCRACAQCYFGPCEHADQDRTGELAHSCCRNAEDVCKIRLADRYALAFPDVGWGRAKWERCGLLWKDPKRKMWRVASHELHTELRNMDGQDPVIWARNVCRPTVDE